MRKHESSVILSITITAFLLAGCCVGNRYIISKNGVGPLKLNESLMPEMMKGYEVTQEILSGCDWMSENDTVTVVKNANGQILLERRMRNSLIEVRSSEFSTEKGIRVGTPIDEVAKILGSSRISIHNLGG